jgi:hypothetical protein
MHQELATELCELQVEIFNTSMQEGKIPEE